MKCKYFKLYELLPKELYRDENYGWDLFDERLLVIADEVREILGTPLICNTWKNGGVRRYSCARIPACKEYRRGSYHSIREDRRVMAIDLVSNDMSAENMRIMIKENASRLSYPIRIEEGVSWLHIDVAAKEGYKVYGFRS